MALIDGITHGLSLAVLGDGSIVHLERPKVRAWTLVHSAADGTRLAFGSHRRAVTDVAAHPTDAAAGIATVPTRGVNTVTPTAGAVTLTASADAPDAVTLGATGTTITVVTRGRGAKHLTVDPATGTVTDVGKAPSGVVDLVAHPTDATAVLALAGWAPRRRLYVLRAGSAPQPIAKTPEATRIAAFAPADPRLAIGFSDGRTALLDLTTPTTAPTVVDAGAGGVWGLATRGDEVLVGTGTEVRVVPLVEAPGVEITIDAEHYLASWTRARITCRGGVSFDSLLFAVDPPEGGLVSASRDASFDPAHPDVLVAMGGVVGEYKLLALDATTGAVHTSAAFTVTDAWSGVDGPPLALIGPAENSAPDAAWGGGDPYVPQNLDVRPRRGDYRVAVLLVETDEQTTLTATEATAMAQSLRDEIFTGVVRGGVLESTRLYFDAVSDGQLNLVDAGVIVPVRLPRDWDDYVDPEASGRTQGDGLSNFTTAAVAEIVRQNRDRAAAGQPPLIDLDTVDSIVTVMRSIPADMAGFPGRHQWPYGTRPGGYQMNFIVGEDRIPGPFGIEFAIPRIRTIQALTMPTTWTSISGGRTLAETVAHELGHNFGLHDAYWNSDKHLAEYQSREPGTWDLMGNEGGAPEPAVVERMHLGWVPGGQVRTISVGVAGYVDEEVTLHPSGRGVPVPAGRQQAVELRIADGRNYYFEYRRRNASALSDQATPEDFVILGSDYVSGDTPPVDRRPLLLMRNDPDSDNATFGLNDDYREQDTSDPSYPNDFEMTVLETAAEFARVRLRYADAKPDPSIRPWAQSTNWKSPDLRVENHRNRLNPALRDVPWENHDNWIVATIRNTGRDVANNIEVTFAVKDFTLGGGAETPLGSIVIPALAAGADTEVSSPDVWRPPALSAIPFFDIRPHYCVVARITAQPDEITRDNNEAQSNHTRMISASGSPSTRETGVVRVTNPHAVPARCRVVVRQTDRLSRTYLERAWVLLGPGEERDVTFWTESMIGDPALDRLTERGRSQSWEMPNSLRLTGVADTGEGCHGDVTGGAHVDVWFGRRTRFVDLYVGRGHARGRVEVEEDGDGVWGTVVVSLREDKEGKDLGVYEGRVENGNFAFEFRGEPGDLDGARVAQAEFNGGYSAAAAISEWVEVQQ